MRHDTNTPAGSDTGMHLRKMALPDGRYMIFYTFGGSAPESAAAEPAENRPAAPGRNAGVPPARPAGEEAENV